MDKGRSAPDPNVLLDQLCDVLVSLGVPLTRATAHAPALHPQFRWVMRVWQPGATVEEIRRKHGIESTSTFHGNTVEYVSSTGQSLNFRPGDSFAERFPVLLDLWKEGITHYVMLPLKSTQASLGAASWATNAEGGFLPSHVQLFQEIADAFSFVFEFKCLRGEFNDILATYVGYDPAHRILAGTVQRGDVCRARAAIMLTDLRSFGELSDTLPETHVVELLNEYFDCIVPYVHSEGGEVLKYIGDGVLAVFDESRQASPCQAAYEAARSALAALSARNAAQHSDAPQLHIGIALHYGEVAYGNIGSENRLDFTTIGRDVNIASRLERFCRTLQQPMLMTHEFAIRVAGPIVEIGRFRFRGFRQEETVFGLAAAAANPSPLS